MNNKKVLIISKVRTHPVKMGNNKAILAQAEKLREIGCNVDFLYVQEMGLHGNKEENERSFILTKNYWGEHFLFLKVSKIEKFFKNIIHQYRKVFNGRREGVYDQYPWRLTHYVKVIQEANHYDVCLVQYYYLTKLFKKVKFDKMACFTHDVFAYKNLLINEKCFWIDANQEARAVQLCTDILAIQEEEKSYYHILSPQSRVYNVYTPYTYYSTPIMGNRIILFLSGNNAFNQNGLRWFINDVFPLIKKRFFEAKLIVAGGICNVIGDEYNQVEGFELLGYVDDPLEFYKMGDVAINPVDQGTGSKIKTFESISYDKVTIVHPHSTAGVFMKDRAPYKVSDKPDDWVRFLEEIWLNKGVIESIKEKNRSYIEEMNAFITNEYVRLLSSK